ncbi:MAG: 7-carboxy-7-deazaguanine synthase QueE [Bacteroidia bacterium]|nr:7-carboxy-7-deazaguanine synthase QueE [Bacteroidia bacterium]
MYPVVEHFYTLQGEGYWAGQPAYFVRLGGCDVGCSWCDTRYSWPKEGWDLYTPEEIREWITRTPARHVVLTGGEPTMHPLSPLIDTLRQGGLFVQLETSGAYPLPDVLPDWITLSPKRFRPPLPSYYEVARELKVVIHARSDFGWAEQQLAFCPPTVQAYLQPEAYQPETLSWIIAYLKEHPRWRLSLQWHRYLAIP